MVKLCLLFALAAAATTLGVPTLPRTYSVSAMREPYRRGDEVDDRVGAALTGIANEMRSLKSRYAQLSEIDGVILTGSQLAYDHGRVDCSSKTKPCLFGPNACRVTINLTRIRAREEAKRHAATSSHIIALRDGTFLDVAYEVLAEQTQKGRSFTRAIDRVIRKHLRTLERQLARPGKRSD